MADCISDTAFSEEADIIFIFGFGLGYELKKMLEKDEERTYIIVEPDEDIFRVMIENVNIDFMINSPYDIGIYVGKDLTQIMNLLDNVINKLKSLKIKLVISPMYKAIYYQLYKRIIESLRLKLNRYISNIRSINLSDKVWYKNYAKNLNYIGDTCPVKVLDGIFKDVPAVICAAGPSLSYHIKKLREIKENVLIVSVGTGITILESNGIKAHIAGAMDGNESEGKLFENLVLNKDVNLFYSLQVYDKVLEYTGKYKFAMNQTNMDLYVSKRFDWNTYGKFSGNSIANVMAENLAKLGCNPIIFLGQDLCYSRNKNYAEGAVSHYEISNEKFESSSEYIKVKNNKGEYVYTKPSFISMRDVMERIIALNPNTEFFNGSEDGLNIKGAKNINFDDYYDEKLSILPEKNFNNTIKYLHNNAIYENINSEFIKYFLKELKNTLNNIIIICESTINIIESDHIISTKEKYIRDFEDKLNQIGFYREVLKFSVENIEFLTPKSYLERKLNVYLYVLDKCYIMLNNIQEEVHS
nr:6-hydroxymethylpterin diphosphokinase MptE-like protein [Clostridium guangxiense]